METGGWEFPSVFIFDFFEDGQGVALDGEPKPIHVIRIPAQIHLERICLDPKGAGQDSPE